MYFFPLTGRVPREKAGVSGTEKKFPDSVEIGTVCLLGEAEGGEAVATVG